MIQKNLYVDLEYCFGCRVCEVACKQENNIPVGVKRINVVTVGPRIAEGKLKTDFVPMRCRHCAKAPCIDACREGAISKRSDGIVLINPELCIGCMLCSEKCPFGAIQLNPETQAAEMCNLCFHRTDAGLEPACVHHCPADCMYFGNINDIMKIIRKKQSERMLEKETGL